MALEIVEHLEEEGVEDLLALYRTCPWWEDRTREEVERAVEHTDLLVALRDDGDLVAAARVLTDFVHYGKVYDVIVQEDRRREGVGAWLLEAVTAHPDLDGLDVLTLDCREGLVGFYRGCGFVRREPIVEVDGDEEELVAMRYAGGA